MPDAQIDEGFIRFGSLLTWYKIEELGCVRGGTERRKTLVKLAGVVVNLRYTWRRKLRTSDVVGPSVVRQQGPWLRELVAERSGLVVCYCIPLLFLAAQLLAPSAKNLYRNVGLPLRQEPDIIVLIIPARSTVRRRFQLAVGERLQSMWDV